MVWKRRIWMAKSKKGIMHRIWKDRSTTVTTKMTSSMVPNLDSTQSRNEKSRRIRNVVLDTDVPRRTNASTAEDVKIPSRIFFYLSNTNGSDVLHKEKITWCDWWHQTMFKEEALVADHLWDCTASRKFQHKSQWRLTKWIGPNAE